MKTYLSCLFTTTFWVGVALCAVYIFIRWAQYWLERDNYYMYCSPFVVGVIIFFSYMCYLDKMRKK